MESVVAELLQYGLAGLAIIGLGWAYMQERADRKAAEGRLMDYLGKDREAVLSVCHLATSALAEAAQAHRANKDYMAALAAKLIDAAQPRIGA